jgi:DNA-binding NarL/FixJ family response regulator
MIRVVIVDDHPLHTMGLKVVLEEDPDISVVGLASSGAEAVQLAMSLQPDVVVMDVRMPDCDGIEATRAIKRSCAALSGFDDEEVVVGILKAGASGYVLKDAPFAEIATAVRRVSAGQSYLTPSVARSVLFELQRHPGESAVPNDQGLTPRELEVLRLLGRGMSNREIAVNLVISERTVENHIRSTYTKLGIRTRTQALLHAVRLGLVRPVSDAGGLRAAP